jgi:hypothetical protein
VAHEMSRITPEIVCCTGAKSTGSEIFKQPDIALRSLLAKCQVMTVG